MQTLLIILGREWDFYVWELSFRALCCTHWYLNQLLYIFKTGINIRSGATECTACPGFSTTDFYGAKDLLSCICPEGFYSTDQDASHCEVCPYGGYCAGIYIILYIIHYANIWGEGGSAVPVALEGYWSSKDNPYKYRECIFDFMCPGGAPGTYFLFFYYLFIICYCIY